MGSGRREVVWTDSARHDVDLALAHFSEDSPGAAAELLEEILAAAESLSDLSARGRHSPNPVADDLRELLVSRYRLLYRVADPHVFIVALLHQRRDFEKWLAEIPRERLL